MIPSERAHLNVTAISHPGMTGKNNEDRYGVSAYYVDAERSTPSLLAVVADGIGGHRAGEVAAEIAVETISRTVAESDGSQPVAILQEAIKQASQAINGMSEEDPNQKGMGSTCACAWIIGARLHIATVGDSRIYLIRNDAIQQLTTDHTWVQEAIDHGLITPEQAHGHPNSHVIRRFLGSQQGVVPDTRLRLHKDESDALAEANQGTLLHPGDVLVLCSDGLTDLVENEEILLALRSRNTKGALEDLVKMSNRRGGHDNVTIVALAVPPVEVATIPVPVPRSRSRLWLPLVIAGVLGLALLALAIGLLWAFLRPDGGPMPTETPLQEQQATLFPQEAATLPAVLPAVDTPAAPAAPGETPLEGGAATPGGGVIEPPQETLTPWPTNTVGP